MGGGKYFLALSGGKGGGCLNPSEEFSTLFIYFDDLP